MQRRLIMGIVKLILTNAASAFFQAYELRELEISFQHSGGPFKILPFEILCRNSQDSSGGRKKHTKLPTMQVYSYHSVQQKMSKYYFHIVGIVELNPVQNTSQNVHYNFGVYIVYKPANFRLWINQLSGGSVACRILHTLQF